MRLRTKLEKLEKELKTKEEEIKITITHELIHEGGRVEKLGTQEIVIKGGRKRWG